MNRSIVGVALALSLFLAPLAHADSAYVPIGDPYTDTIGLWSDIASALSSLANDFASLFNGQEFAVAPPATPPAALAAAAADAPAQPPTQRDITYTVLAGDTLSGIAQTFSIPLSNILAANNLSRDAILHVGENLIISVSQTAPATSNEPASTATSDQTTLSQNVKSAQFSSPQSTAPADSTTLSDPTPAFNASDFVTQSELAQALIALSPSPSTEFAPTTAPAVPLADGNPFVPYAAVSNIGQLSNVTITNANLSASEIPALDYLSLSGGTLAGALTSSSTATTTFAAGFNILSGCFSINGACISAGGGASLSAANTWAALQQFQAGASTTNVSIVSNAYFGGTATSSFNSAGLLTLAAPLAVTSGGTGWSSLASGYIPFGNGSSGLATSTNLFFDAIDGRLGIGTTSPNQALTVNGNINIATSSNGLYIGNTPFLSAAFYAGGNVGAGVDTNTLIGTNAGLHLATSSGLNTVIGSYAGGSGAGLLDIGSHPCEPNCIGGTGITSNENTLIGWQSGTQLTTGGFNTAIGVNTMGLEYDGGLDTAIGNDAMRDTMDTNNSVAIGQSALREFEVASSSFDIAIGNNALNGTSSAKAVSLLAIGYHAMSTTSITSSATDDVAVGNNALDNGISAFQDVVVGQEAAQNAEDSSNDVILGYNAFNKAYHGSGYVVIGANALDNLNGSGAGQGIVAIGLGAMSNFNNGNANTYDDVAIGDSALSGGTSAGGLLRNIGIGGDTGLTLTSGSDNIFIGENSGRSVTSGGTNIFIGSNAASTTSGSSNIVLGYDISLPSASASNQLDFGNLIFGTGINGQGTTVSTGGISIGTTTPYARLTVWGSDAASSTSAFAVVNSASTTLFSVFDGGNAELSGSLSQSSDERLKTNIQSLDASSSLSLIQELNPVTFNWIDPNKGSTPQLGFIAQQVLQIFPNLVSTTSATALTPGGTLSLNYIGLISPIVSAIQAISAEISSIENTVAGFAQSITTDLLTATTVQTQQLCVGSTCVTPAQFQAIVAAASASQSSGQGSGGASADDAEATDTPPVIQVNGDNPAVIQVGATYNDLGATITGPTADLNLGIQTVVNGTEMSPVQLDTTQAATDTIDYVATDQNGLSSTTTRTVIIEAPSIDPSDDASSTSTTSDDSAATTSAATSTSS